MRLSVPSKELEKRRQRAVDADIRGKTTVASVARKFQVNIRTVYTWLASFRKNGAKGLQAKPGPGAPRKLKKSDFKLLEKMLLRGAKAAEFPNELWTCARVAELIRKEFGVEYHFNHVGKLLAQMGWSPQRPEKRAVERDDRRIRDWVKKNFQALKKCQKVERHNRFCRRVCLAVKPGCSSKLGAQRQNASIENKDAIPQEIFRYGGHRNRAWGKTSQVTVSTPSRKEHWCHRVCCVSRATGAKFS